MGMRTIFALITLVSVIWLFIIVTLISSPVKPISHVPIHAPPTRQFLVMRNNARLARLYEKYRFLLNLTQFKTNYFSTKTMIYSCESFCGGWGDRLRGIISTFVLALLTDRRFMIDMNYPCEISQTLLPNLVNWTYVKSKNADNRTRIHINTMRSWQSEHRKKIETLIKSKDFVNVWLPYDDVIITTNSDYMILALRNKLLINRTRKLLGRLSASEATMQTLFPLLFEILFQPSRAVLRRVDSILSHIHNRHLICLHIRVGKNPTNPFDHSFTARANTTQTMIEFIDTYPLYRSSSIIFVTSDSGQAISEVLHHYPNSSLTIVGPILHIDRFDARSPTICNGFVKTIADFYVLGECHASILSQSGFSAWANRRREKPNEELYFYNEKLGAIRKS